MDSDKLHLVSELNKIPKEELANDLADLIIVSKNILEKTGFSEGFNLSKLPGVLMKLQFNPKAFSAEIGFDKLQPLFKKYKSLTHGH